jgi:hypothetical protein
VAVALREFPQHLLKRQMSVIPSQFTKGTVILRTHTWNFQASARLPVRHLPSQTQASVLRTSTGRLQANGTDLSKHRTRSFVAVCNLLSSKIDNTRKALTYEIGPVLPLCTVSICILFENRRMKTCTLYLVSLKLK